MQDVTGITALELAPTSADDLVTQLNEAAAVRAWWPVLLIVPILGWAAAFWLRLSQRARRSVVVFYEVEDGSGEWFEELTDAWAGLSRSAGLWRTTSKGALHTTYQRKVNAGASTLINRVSAAVSAAGPRVLVTNILVPSVQVGRESLHFLPDRVLVRAGRRYTEVSYAQLNVYCSQTRYIEDGRVPRDATRVGTTWKYANVRGGPDRRFKNNRQLPILGYAEMAFTTASGLRWMLQSSNFAAAETAAAVLSRAHAPTIAPGPKAPPAQQLLSDSEREAAVEQLRTAYLDGRLTQPEFDERSGAVLAARRQVELNTCLEGIPLPASKPPQGVSPVATPPHVRPAPVTSGQPASWGRRAGAWIIDAVICSVAYFILLMIGFAILIGVTGKSSPKPAGWLTALFLVLGPAVFITYQVGLLARSGIGNGQTVGKRLLRVRVVTADGGLVTASDAFRREGLVVTLLGIVTLGTFLLVDAVWPLRDGARRALHDLWTETSVVSA